MFCQNCGSNVPAGTPNCPNCGAVLTNNQQSAGMQQTMYSGTIPPIKNRSIAMSIILTIVTCGIYGLYWLICMTDESNSLSDQNKTASGGMTILWILLSCGIYSFYWYYKMGKKLHEAGLKYGKTISDNSVLYIILSVLGLGVVSEILIQADLNKFANQ